MKGLIKFSALVIVLAFFLGGCAIGVTKIDVTHDPINTISDKKEGNILVKKFVDKREGRIKGYIGNKRNVYGMVLGNIESNEKLELLLTKYFAEALEAAGYTVVIQKKGEDLSNFDVVLEGEILEFWLDLYVAVWQKVDVMLKLTDKETSSVLWEKEVKGEETNALWIGASSEYEKVVREALNKALNEAAKEFASDEFYQAVK